MRARLAALRDLAADPGAELLVAGRMASADLRWLERETESRTRALIEERGLRTASAGTLVGRPNRRPAQSVLGALLDRDGAGALGRLVATLSDGALIDSRVLLAHRMGAEERGWPPAEDRFASDLLLSDRVRDPWLAELTAAAAASSAPILLGGHGLVGPGARLALALPARSRRGMSDIADPGDPAVLAWYRSDPLPDPESVGEDEGLVAAIRGEIARDGPITFARFMERALYEPGHGYYRRSSPGPGRDGDFLTSPEAHPIFGAALGRLVEQAWDAMGRPAPFLITEPGAGTGALAEGLLAGLRDLGSPLFDAARYQPVEIEHARLGSLRARLAAAGLAERLVVADDDAATRPAARPAVGALIANEVLDALPVHRVVGRGDGPRELLVTADEGGGFDWLEGAAVSPAIDARLADEGITLADGQVTEVCLALDGWLADATRSLARGIVVLVDYAQEPEVLHGPGHPQGRSAPSPATPSAATRSGTSAART